MATGARFGAALWSLEAGIQGTGAAEDVQTAAFALGVQGVGAVPVGTYIGGDAAGVVPGAVLRLTDAGSGAIGIGDIGVACAIRAGCGAVTTPDPVPRAVGDGRAGGV